MKQNWVEKALQREFNFRIFDLICKGPLQKNYEKCKGFPTGHPTSFLNTSRHIILFLPVCMYVYVLKL